MTSIFGSSYTALESVPTELSCINTIDYIYNDILQFDTNVTITEIWYRKTFQIPNIKYSLRHYTNGSCDIAF